MKTSTAYRYAARRVVSDAKWKAIVAKAVDQAVNGDGEARRWLASIIVNDPTPENVDDVLNAHVERYLAMLNTTEDDA